MIRRALDTRARHDWGPIVQFALSSVALLVLVAAIGAVTLRHLATAEALRDARSVTVAFSRGMLRNAVTPGVLRGDKAALAALDRRVHETVLGHPIVRLKVWSPSGRIVYSDARGLIGRRFPLPADLRGSMDDNAVRADVSDLSRPENRFERGRGRLVEVYLPLRLAGGQLVMVEAYHPAGEIDAASSRTWRVFLPMILGLLVALAAVQLPLVWTQSRRARADAREREELARDAERALQAERARIATELHGGIVQDLAGVAYALHATAGLPADTPDSELRAALAQGADVCRTSMTRMRELLADLRNPHSREQDLHGAIDAVARPLRNAGAEVDVDVHVSRPIEGDMALLIHSAAREILLDLRRQPTVSTVRVGLVEHAGDIVLSVEHNGAGVDASRDQAGPAPGRRLGSLADRLSARGGSLTVVGSCGRGNRLTATLPQL
jgi:two-component system, NarL family, sensor kinase